MTDFWRLVFPSIIWSLATLCDTLITIRENHWLLRLTWRFSESVSEYESVFRMRVWKIIHEIISSMHFICTYWKKCNNLYYFHKVKKMCFFPRNGAILNDSLCFFIYQDILFPRSGKISSDFCYFHKVRINT